MNIALLYPEALDLARFGENRKEFPPLGIMILASQLENYGFKVRIIKITNENYCHDFREFDVVGFSLASSATYNLMKKTRFYSLFKANGKIIAGGFHATLYPKEILIDLKVNLICIGDGEKTIIDIVSATSDTEIEKINNICFIKNGVPVETQKQKRILSHWNIPARHLLPLDDIFLNDRLAQTNYKMAHVMFSRGCNGGCHFCAVPIRNVTYQSISKIEEELHILKHSNYVEGIAIIDNNFFHNPIKAIEISKILQKHKLKWSALSRIECVNDKLLKIVKQNGCLEIKFGIESGSQLMLDRMNKNISLEQIKFSLMKTKENNINTKITLIHGFPGENIKTTNETIQFIQGLRKYIDRLTLIRFVPLPGSFVFNHPTKYCLVSELSNSFSNIDWDMFHIYNNSRHWWGNSDNYKELLESYKLISNFVSSEYDEQSVSRRNDINSFYD